MKYTPSSRGVSELANSAAVSNACFQAGMRVEAIARATPVEGPAAAVREYRDAFRTERATVQMAKTGEKRAGAIVMNDSRMERTFGGRGRVLFNALRGIDGVSL